MRDFLTTLAFVLIDDGWCRPPAGILIAAILSFAINVAPVAARGAGGTGDLEGAKIEPVRGRFLSNGASIDEFHCVPARAGRFPVVMLLHGCAPDRFGALEFKQMCVGLAERGYYAMFIEYYGAAGAPNCRELAMAPRVSLAPETPLPDDIWMHDLISARNSLANNAKADTTRLGVIGFSFGSTLGVITAALNPNVISAIVDYYGFSNSHVEDAVGRHSNFPPTLILQGDADTRAHVNDSIHLHNAIAKLQQSSEIRVYPGVEHGFNFRAALGYDQEASEDAWSRALSFLDRHLR